MNLVIDANIIFSGILNTDGKIADLLINSQGHLRFIAPDYLRKEIKNHYPKLVTISKLPLQQIREAEFQILKTLRLYRRNKSVSLFGEKLTDWYVMWTRKI